MRNARITRGLPTSGIARARGGLGIAPPPTPADILGASLHTWLAPGAGELSLSGLSVAAWSNRAGNGNPAQGDSLLRPTYAAAGVSGKPAVDFDGTQGLLVTTGAPFVADSRPYIWVVGQRSAGTTGVLASIQKPSITTGDSYVTLLADDQGNANITVTATLGDGTETIEGPVTDALPHLIEYGCLETIADKLVVDGVGYDGTLTGGLSADLAVVIVGASAILGSLFAQLDGLLAEVVIATSLPTAHQTLAMRQYFRDRGYGLSIA